MTTEQTLCAELAQRLSTESTLNELFIECEVPLYAPPYINSDGDVLWPGDASSGIQPWKTDVCVFNKTGKPDNHETAAVHPLVVIEAKCNYQTDAMLTANEKFGRIKTTYPHAHGLLIYFWLADKEAQPWLSTAKVPQLLTNFDGYASIRYEQGSTKPRIFDSDYRLILDAIRKMADSAHRVAKLISNPSAIPGSTIGWMRTVDFVQNERE